MVHRSHWASCGFLDEGWVESGRLVRPSDEGRRGMQRLSTVGAAAPRGVREILRDEKGQGTTEYAILVGVLVVIAILAIIAFRGKVQELWNAIVSGMNSL